MPMIDPYLYPESDVLRNLADIRNEETLHRLFSNFGILCSKTSSKVLSDFNKIPTLFL